MPDPAANRVTTACPSCGKQFAVRAEGIGRQAKCPACESTFTIAPHEAPAAPAAASDGVCPVCQSPIGEGEATLECPSCRSVYHAECWEYNHGCGQYGCEQAPATEKLDELEIPASYWGKEEKACPQCGRVIQAAAVRCRWCGSTFESARPVDSQQFADDRAIKGRVRTVRTQAIWLLIFSIFTCTAPLAAVVGLFWYRANRRVIATMPAFSSAMCIIAVGLAWVQTGILVLMATIHAMMSAR